MANNPLGDPATHLRDQPAREASRHYLRFHSCRPAAQLSFPIWISPGPLLGLKKTFTICLDIDSMISLTMGRVFHRCFHLALICHVHLRTDYLPFQEMSSPPDVMDSLLATDPQLQRAVSGSFSHGLVLSCVLRTTVGHITRVFSRSCTIKLDL